jgi:hypothetical protein
MRLQLAGLAIAVGGCVATVSGGGGGYYSSGPGYANTSTTTTSTVTVSTYEPELVDVSPGVQVVYDYDEPIFYSDNFYWRYDGGVWYRSSAYNTGFVVYNDVPVSVRRIDRPHEYRHYRPASYTPRAQRPGYRPPGNNNNTYRPEPAVRDHRSPEPYRAPEPAVRDHRYDRPTPAPAPAPAPVPVRDHRYDHPTPAPAPAPAPTPVRDHRYDRPTPAPAPAPAAPVRDHRNDKKDDRDKPYRP